MSVSGEKPELAGLLSRYTVLARRKNELLSEKRRLNTAMRDINIMVEQNYHDVKLDGSSLVRWKRVTTFDALTKTFFEKQCAMLFTERREELFKRSNEDLSREIVKYIWQKRKNSLVEGRELQSLVKDSN